MLCTVTPDPLFKNHSLQCCAIMISENPVKPWGAAEKEAWLSNQSVQRPYSHVLKRIDALRTRFEVHQYGSLSYAEDYPLFVVKSSEWDEKKPTVLVTGGGVRCA